MSDIIDDDLLNDEDGLDDVYDITHEREEALLQDDDEYIKESDDSKNNTYSDAEEDVLNLDAEDYFQDDEKFEDEIKEGSSGEKTPAADTSDKNQASKLPDSTSGNTKPLARKNPPSNRETPGRFRRGRGGYQHRNNWNKRRNGTVLINPRYEGTVRVADNNARLAWDSSPYPHNENKMNYVPPWDETNYTPNFQEDSYLPQRLNFYEPPPNYEPKLSFEPPPHLNQEKMMQPYHSQRPPYMDWNNSFMQPPPSYPGDTYKTNYNLHQDQYNTHSYPNYNNERNLIRDPLPPKNNQFDYNRSNYQNNYSDQMNFSKFDSTNYYQNTSKSNGYVNDKNMYQNITSMTNRRDFGNNTYNKNNKYNRNQQQGQFRKNLTVPINKKFSPNQTETQEVKKEEEIPEKKIKIQDATPLIEENLKDEDTSSMTVKREIEDEETRMYRQKIEEQKRERERILRMKEERRQQMAIERQNQEKNVLTAAVAEAPSQQPNNNQTIPNNNVQNKKPFPRKQQQQFTSPFNNPPNTYHRQNVVLCAPTNQNADLDNITFKVTNDRQLGAFPKIEQQQSCSGFMSNRVVTVKSNNSQDASKPLLVSNNSGNLEQSVSSFLSNRKVLKKDNDLSNTRLVVVSNLSASTDRNKLMMLSRGIGEIQTLQLDSQERQATILFKTVASAHAFLKKYHRRILDLSIIEVKLEPML